MTPAEAERLSKEAVKSGEWTPGHDGFWTGLAPWLVERAVAALVLRVEEAAHARGADAALEKAAKEVRELAAGFRANVSPGAHEDAKYHWGRASAGAEEAAHVIDRLRGERGTT